MKVEQLQVPADIKKKTIQSHLRRREYTFYPF